MHEIDKPLWNMYGYFFDNMQQMLTGKPVDEKDPKLVVMRLPHDLGNQVLTFQINYKKSSSPASGFHGLNLRGTDPAEKLSEVKQMIQERRDSFDSKFENVFGLNQNRFD
jgi:hypothetical protein